MYYLPIPKCSCALFPLLEDDVIIHEVSIARNIGIILSIIFSYSSSNSSPSSLPQPHLILPYAMYHHFWRCSLYNVELCERSSRRLRMPARMEIGISFLSWSFGWAADLFICQASTWAGQKPLDRKRWQHTAEEQRQSILCHPQRCVSSPQVSGHHRALEVGSKDSERSCVFFAGVRSWKIWKKLRWSCLMPAHRGPQQPEKQR